MPGLPRRERRTPDEQALEVERRMLGPTLGGRTALAAPVARRQAASVAASAGSGPAIKYIQDAQPGTMRPRELWLDTDEPAPALTPGGALADQGFFGVTTGGYFGTSVTSGSITQLAPISESNNLTDTGLAIWDTDHFEVQAAGLYVVTAYVVLDGTVDEGAIFVDTPVASFGPSVLYTGWGGDIGGFDYSGQMVSPLVPAGVGGTFFGSIHANGTGMTIAGAELFLYPIALF